ncbi:MAG: ATP-dependent helicase [Candidatus Dormibacteria bacterium]
MADLEPAPAAGTLDPSQERAVGHGAGPALVLAGPGSGKTRVIVERYCRLITAEGLDPAEILLVTFADAAAQEMLDRIEDRLGHRLGEHFISTYHSFSMRVLSEEGWRLGMAHRLRVPPVAVRWDLAEDLLRAAGPGLLYSPTRPRARVRDLLALVDRAKQELIDPQDYARWVAENAEGLGDEGRLHGELSRFYSALDRRYQELGYMDFADQLRLAVRCLEQSPEAQERFQTRFRFVMVDEFQDTDVAQARLLELVSAAGNLLVVADDDQSIYKFRGASLANMRRFRQQHPEHLEISLDRNYRSTPEVVAAATALISAAADREPKSVVAVRPPGVTVSLVAAADARAEARHLARACRRRLDAPGGAASASSIAFLVRKHAHMEPLFRALEQEGVPYTVVGGRDYFRSPDVKALTGLLRAISDPDDGEALVSVLRLPGRELSPHARVRLTRERVDTGRPLLDLLLEPSEKLEEPDRQRAREIAETLLELHALSQRDSAREVFHVALDRTAYMGILAGPESVERLQVIANLNKFADLVESFMEYSADSSLRAFMRFLELTVESGDQAEMAELDGRLDAVRIMTVHGAKGLEFDHVFVPSLVDGRFPSREQGDPFHLPDTLVPEPAPEGDAHLEEERRLLYVAMTRARDSLTLSWAQRYTTHSRPHRGPTALLEPLAGIVTGEGAEFVSVGDPAREQPPRLVRIEEPVSFSRLRDFAQCPRRFQYRHIFRLPERADPRALLGARLHRALENGANRRLGGDRVGGAELAQALRDEIAVSGPLGLSQEVVDHGLRLLTTYGDGPAWLERHPARLERRFNLEWGAHTFTGVIDRVDAEDGVPVLVDYKSGASGRGIDRDLELQLALYWKAETSVDVKTVRMEAHFLEDNTVLRWEPEPARLNSVLNQLQRRANELRDALEARSFPPHASAWNCTSCPFRLVCDEGRQATGG